MREIMARIKKNFIFKKILLDDLDVKNHSLIKRFKRKIDKKKNKKYRSINLIFLYLLNIKLKVLLINQI